MSNTLVPNIPTAPWLKVAASHLGLKEIKGPQHNKTIIMWLEKLNAWWRDDEIPWCAVMVAACMQECGLPFPKLYMRALEWNDYGVKLLKPVPGCIVTFTRQGGGHVGFVVGESTDGKLLVLGGNQSDMVTIAKFDYSRVTSYRWPAGIPVPDVKLAKHSVTGSVSTNEA